MILTPLQKFPKNVGDLGKPIVAEGFEKLPKVQKIARSGHTDCGLTIWSSTGRVSADCHLLNPFEHE